MRDKLLSGPCVVLYLALAKVSLHLVLTGRYGVAGAVDFFGPAYGLPRAIATLWRDVRNCN